MVALTILQILALNALQFTDHVTMATPPFENNFSGILCGLSLGACVPNLNSASLATLEAAKFHQNRLKN